MNTARTIPQILKACRRGQCTPCVGDSQRMAAVTDRLLGFGAGLEQQIAKAFRFVESGAVNDFVDILDQFAALRRRPP